MGKGSDFFPTPTSPGPFLTEQTHLAAHDWPTHPGRHPGPPLGFPATYILHAKHGVEWEDKIHLPSEAVRQGGNTNQMPWAGPRISALEP